MVVRTIRTNELESGHILNHHQRFILRSAKEKYKVGDVFHFQLYKNGKPVTHEINNKPYLITVIKDDRLLPLEKGFQLVGFREL